MTYLKIGLLGSVSGNLTGATEKFTRPIHNAGQPVPLANNDSPGAMPDAIAMGNDGHFLYRVARTGNEGFAVPDYSMDPEPASLKHRALILPYIDQHVQDNRDKYWIKTINEPDRTKASWIGDFSYWQAIHMGEADYKVAMGAWSVGTPDYDAWFTPGYRRYLSYVAERPDQAAICLHEYSLNVDDIWNAYPYFVGRFQFLLEACDIMKIKRPPIFFGEWGWEPNSAPGWSVGMQHIHEVASLYAIFESVRAAGLWYSGSWQGSNKLANTINQYFEHLGDLGENWHSIDLPAGIEPIVPIIQPPIDPDPGVKRVVHQYPQEYGELDAVTAFPLAYREYKRTWTASHDDAAALEQAGNADSHIVIYDPDRPSQVTAAEHYDEIGSAYTVKYVFDDPPDPGDPLDGLEIGAPFRKPFVLTAGLDEPRPYGKHEGADYDIVGEPAESSEPVICGVVGRVSVAGNAGTAYGFRVYIDFEYNGVPCTISYAHMDSVFVAVGQLVEPGDELGELGGQGKTEDAFAEHVHINLQAPHGDNTNYVIPDVIDPVPYISMEPVNDPDPPGSFDITPFILGDGRRYYLRSAADHQELLQTQTDGLRWYQVKNTAWESFFLSQGYVCRDTDTSPGGGRYYTLRDHSGAVDGSRWMPQLMRVGQSFTTDLVRVQFYHKRNCTPSSDNSGNVRDTRVLVARHTDWVSRYGIVVPDVIEIHWTNGNETYFYGEDYGLVGWERGHNDPNTPVWTSIVSTPEGGNNDRESGCFGG